MKKTLLLLLTVLMSYYPNICSFRTTNDILNEERGKTTKEIIKYTSFNEENNGLYITLIIPEYFCGDIIIASDILNNEVNNISINVVTVYMDIINNSQYTYYYEEESFKTVSLLGMDIGNKDLKVHLYYIEPSMNYELGDFLITMEYLNNLYFEFNLNSYEETTCGEI